MAERFTVSVPEGVNVRSDPSTSGRIHGAACNGRDCIMRRFSPDGRWGYTDRIICTNGVQDGWICLENMTKGFPCRIAASPCLRLRRNPGSTSASNTVLTTIPEGSRVICSEIRHFGSSVWMRTTYNGQTGYICFTDGSEQYVFGESDIGTCFWRGLFLMILSRREWTIVGELLLQTDQLHDEIEYVQMKTDSSYFGIFLLHTFNDSFLT